MECSAVQERLSCYLDGILDEATLESMESHLAICADCRMELEALRALTDAAGQIEDLEPPAGLKVAIMEAAKGAQKDPACGEILLLMSDYIDGELAESKAAIVKRHVTVCKSCAFELEMLARTVSVVTSVGEVDPPVDLRDRIAAATVGRKVSVLSMLAQQIRDGLWPKKVGWAAAALAAAAAFVAVVNVHEPRVKTQPVMALKPTPAPVVKPLPKPVPKRRVAAVPDKALAASVRHRVSARSETAKKEPRPVRMASAAEQPTQLRALVQPPVELGKPEKQAPLRPVEVEETSPPTDTAELPVQIKPEPEAPAAPVEPAKVVAQLPPAIGEQPKHEEPQPSLMKIAMPPSSQSRGLQNWAESIKQEAELKRGAGRASSLKLFGTRF